MRQHHDEVSPLFMIGRDGSASDELDAYDDNWDLRDVPLGKPSSGVDANHPDDVRAETELTFLTQRRRGSLHRDEEEAVLCPLVFAEHDEDDDDDDYESSGSQSSSSGFRRGGSPRCRRSHALGGWRPRRRGHSRRRLTIGIGVLVRIAAALAFLAYFPTISEHAVSFKASLNKNSRQLAGNSGTSDEDGFRITFPAALSQFSEAVSTALDALF